MKNVKNKDDVPIHQGKSRPYCCFCKRLFFQEEIILVTKTGKTFCCGNQVNGRSDCFQLYKT